MKMKKIKDIETSVIGFGCWSIGGTWNNTSDSESIKAIKAAIDKGINFFDVAPVYGLGHAEDVLGKALQDVERSNVVLASKCGLVWDNNKQVSNNLTRDSIFKEVEQSLRRLNTDYLDLYQVHWPDPNTPILETADALAELKHQGKIRHVGVSNYSLDMTLEMMKGVEVATFQGLYNLLEQNPTHYHNIPLAYRAREEALPFCKINDMKYLPYSPLMQGLLGGRFKRENNFDNNDDRSNNPKLNGELFEKYYLCTQELTALADAEQLLLPHLALHWLAAQEDVGPVIAGAHNVQQVDSNAAFLDSNISTELLSQAEKIVEKWQCE